MKRMKTVLAVVLALTLALSGSALAAADNSVTATAPGLDETVTVTVTVEDGVITAVEAVTDKEEETVGREALEKIPAAIVENNSLKVDGVAGATLTSRAVLAAATEAYLEALGADIDLGGAAWTPIGAFQPMGEEGEAAETPTPALAFTGSFDGAGHTISNLTISGEASMGVGLFGCAAGAVSWHDRTHQTCYVLMIRLLTSVSQHCFLLIVCIRPV